GDAAGIARARGADRDLVHGASLCPVLPDLGSALRRCARRHSPRHRGRGIRLRPSLSCASMTRIRSAVLAGLALAAALAMPSPVEAARAKKHPPAAPAEAPAPKTQSAAAQPLGTSDSWSAYQATDGTGQVCYLVGKPQKSEPANFARKPPMAMV